VPGGEHSRNFPALTASSTAGLTEIRLRRGQTKRNAQRITELPDELLSGVRLTHALNRDTILHYYSQGWREHSHSSA